MDNLQEINIKSPVFESMLIDLNKEIKRVIEMIHSEEFEGGEISLKLSLTQLDDYKEYPKTDDMGFKESEAYWYKKPYFKHSVSTSLKKQYKQQGQVSPEAEIKLIDNQYLLVPVLDPQISMVETETEEDFLK